MRYRYAMPLILCILLASTSASLFGISYQESSLPQTVAALGVVSFNPSAIKIGSKLFLYVQGGNGTEACGGDHIIAYSAALDPSGHPGTFTKIGRITPCNVRFPNNDPVSFGTGQILQAVVGSSTYIYHIVADTSDQISAPSNFQQLWHASSADGINWSWETPIAPVGANPEVVQESGDSVSHSISMTTVAAPFLQASYSGAFVLAPALLSTRPGANTGEWWGFFHFDGGIGEMLVDWDVNGLPTIQILKTPANPASIQFSDFQSLTNGQLTFQPYALSTTSGLIKSLVFDSAANAYQLWGDTNPSGTALGTNVNCDTTITRACTAAVAGPCGSSFPPGQIGCLTANGTQCLAVSGFLYRPFVQNTGGVSASSTAFVWWSGLGRLTGLSGAGNQSGAGNVVTSASCTPGCPTCVPRCMPSGYQTALLTPARYIASDGTQYLFSATNNSHVCTQFLYSIFADEYVVQSTLQFSP